jgi:hypothetical protein
MLVNIERSMLAKHAHAVTSHCASGTVKPSRVIGLQQLNTLCNKQQLFCPHVARCCCKHPRMHVQGPMVLHTAACLRICMHAQGPVLLHTAASIRACMHKAPCCCTHLHASAYACTRPCYVPVLPGQKATGLRLAKLHSQTQFIVSAIATSKCLAAYVLRLSQARRTGAALTFPNPFCQALNLARLPPALPEPRFRKAGLALMSLHCTRCSAVTPSRYYGR